MPQDTRRVYTRVLDDDGKLATILGRVDLVINIWYTHALAIPERRARRVKYIVGGLGLLMAPFLLPLVTVAALVYIVSAVFKDNTGGTDND